MLLPTDVFVSIRMARSSPERKKETHTPEMKEKRRKKAEQRPSLFMAMIVGYKASSLCRGNVHGHESRTLQE
jgi:hypothetical protein